MVPSVTDTDDFTIRVQVADSALMYRVADNVGVDDGFASPAVGGPADGWRRDSVGDRRHGEEDADPSGRRAQPDGEIERQHRLEDAQHAGSDRDERADVCR